MLSDTVILQNIGEHFKSVRLKQNITQQSLAKVADVSISSVKKIEKGEIRSFDSFMRVLRMPGKLEVLQPLVEEDQLSPSECYELVHIIKAKHRRKRASKHSKNRTK